MSLQSTGRKRQRKAHCTRTATCCVPKGGNLQDGSEENCRLSYVWLGCEGKWWIQTKLSTCYEVTHKNQEVGYVLQVTNSPGPALHTVEEAHLLEAGFVGRHRAPPRLGVHAARAVGREPAAQPAAALSEMGTAADTSRTRPTRQNLKKRARPGRIPDASSAVSPRGALSSWRLMPGGGSPAAGGGG
eukprot:gene1359-biopygen22810